MPAISALTPEVVPTDKLMKVSGIDNSIRSLILLISPALGGVILNYFSMEIAMMIDVITAIIGTVFLLIIKIVDTNLNRDKKVASYFKDLSEGFKLVIKNRLIRNLNLFYFIFFFLITPAAMLSPLFITRKFGEEVWRLTFNEIAFSSGTMIGGLLIASWGGFKNKLITVTFAEMMIGLAILMTGFNIGFIVFLVMILVTGIFVPLISSPSVVLMQESVENEYRGRVFGFFNIIANSAFPLGMAFFGPLADYIKIETLFIITGVLISVLGIVIMINKKFMALGIIKNELKTEAPDGKAQ
jgi:DHA3 family macrolide efflux protein-like MFS transporter